MSSSLYQRGEKKAPTDRQKVNLCLSPAVLTWTNGIAGLSANLPRFLRSTSQGWTFAAGREKEQEEGTIISARQYHGSVINAHDGQTPLAVMATIWLMSRSDLLQHLSRRQAVQMLDHPQGDMHFASMHRSSKWRSSFFDDNNLEYNRHVHCQRYLDFFSASPQPNETIEQ